jgi:hypothetical protein
MSMPSPHIVPHCPAWLIASLQVTKNRAAKKDQHIAIPSNRSHVGGTEAREGVCQGRPAGWSRAMSSLAITTRAHTCCWSLDGHRPQSAEVAVVHLLRPPGSRRCHRPRPLSSTLLPWLPLLPHPAAAVAAATCSRDPDAVARAAAGARRVLRAAACSRDPDPIARAPLCAFPSRANKRSRGLEEGDWGGEEIADWVVTHLGFHLGQIFSRSVLAGFAKTSDPKAICLRSHKCGPTHGWPQMSWTFQ